MDFRLRDLRTLDMGVRSEGNNRLSNGMRSPTSVFRLCEYCQDRFLVYPLFSLANILFEIANYVNTYHNKYRLLPHCSE
jgi:hypothetical protein